MERLLHLSFPFLFIVILIVIKIVILVLISKKKYKKSLFLLFPVVGLNKTYFIHLKMNITSTKVVRGAGLLIRIESVKRKTTQRSFKVLAF